MGGYPGDPRSSAARQDYVSERDLQESCPNHSLHRSAVGKGVQYLSVNYDLRIHNDIVIWKTRRRIHGCRQQPRWSYQKEGRYAPDGGSEQSFRALPVGVRFLRGASRTVGSLSKYRHHGSHRCWAVRTGPLPVCPMGSSIAANVGLERLDIFAPVGLLSSGMFRNSPRGMAAIEAIAPDFFPDLAVTRKKLRLFFFSCGTKDDRISALKKTWDDLNARKINFVGKAFPGGHEWRVWRHSLADMAPLLFRNTDTR